MKEDGVKSGLEYREFYVKLMPANPLDSGFFNPVTLPTGAQQAPSGQAGYPIPMMGGANPSPLQLKAGYRNVYGTRVGGTYDPLTQKAGVDVQVPIGDHQRQLFFGVNAQGNPQTKDWGATLSLTKKIAPRTPTAGEAINAITGGALNRSVPGAPGVIQTDLRTNFMNSLTPEQLQMLGQNVKQYQRQAVDEALGIRQGAEKYGFEVGFTGTGQRQQDPIYSLPPEAALGSTDMYPPMIEGSEPGKEQLDSFIKERKLIQ